MNKSRWPSWLPMGFIAGGVILLLVGIINLFPRPAYTSETSSTAPTPAPADSSPLRPTLPQPMPTFFNSPLPAPVIISPVSTPLPPSPTSTPPPTPTSALSLSPELASNSNVTFDGQAAYQHVLAQVAYGPRPTGSETGWATGDFIIATLQQAGWDTETQEFLFKGVKVRNIMGKMGQGPIMILGAHYDTRPAADRDPDPAKQSEWIEGANDGASGVAVLLELARVLEAGKLKNEVWLAFFDAEDRGRLEGWPFSVGARYMAENLVVHPQAVVVVDMIGDADQNIYLERNSTPALREKIWAIAAELGYEAYLIPELKYAIIDDHIPFLERGLPAVDIIDFFNYPYWHTTADTADKVAPESLERVGQTLEVWLEEKQ